MDTLTLILLPMVISSLGFLTYRHPPIARKLLMPLFYIICGLIFLIELYSLAQSNTYFKAMDATHIDIYMNKAKTINIDSLYKTGIERASLNQIITDNENQRDKYREIYNAQTSLRDSTRDKISILRENSQKTTNTYLFYGFIGFLITIILFALTFLFDNIHDKEKISDTNKTK